MTTNPWLVAADDLGVAVTAPAVVDGEDCLALVHDFGSPVGTAVVGRGTAQEYAVTAAAHALGHYVSVVNPDSYATYDRDLFVGTWTIGGGAARAIRLPGTRAMRGAHSCRSVALVPSQRRRPPLR